VLATGGDGDLRGRLDDWRAVLHDETPKAHKLLKQLIVERLEMTPAADRSLYAFRGTGTMLPLLAGVDHRAWRPQREPRKGAT
jgi:hypothetical protein